MLVRCTSLLSLFSFSFVLYASKSTDNPEVLQETPELKQDCVEVIFVPDRRVNFGCTSVQL